MNYVQVLIEYGSLALNEPFLYQCKDPVLPFMRVKVPFRNRSCVGIVTEVSLKKPDVDYEIHDVIQVMDEAPLLNEELQQLARYISRITISPLINVYKTMLPKAWKPSSSNSKRVMEDWLVLDDHPIGEPTKKQKEFLESLEIPVKASQARKKSVSMTKSLLDKHILKIEQKPKQMSVTPENEKKPWPPLQPQQKQALSLMEQNDGRPILLYGVTGSGKTEVFFHMAHKALDEGKQVLFLVPEIGLTPMMIERVTSRFDVPVYIYHSRLSDTEAASQYEQISKMKKGIVIGTRSAVFLPFSNLGLIIMDEEHDHSYKQQNAPRYHTKDAAIFRANWHHCPLILASATPSLESYSRAWKNKYQLVQMNERVSGRFAMVSLIDMKTQQSYMGLSTALIKAMEHALSKGQQVILLLNRRGYLPQYTCTSCGHTLLCEDCALPLSYHKKEHKLKCHVCSREYPVPERCPECGSKAWSEQGTGTQKLEEAVAKLFPAARILRMDADTTRAKNAHGQLLSEFEAEGDILIGTQMVAKGLDFERVTLVGILSGDGMLTRADYRAAETGYEMMEQAAGRAGRGRFEGRVLIQTWNPDHYALNFIRQHDYLRFFQREMAYRHLGSYPPYVFMATLVFSHTDPMKSYSNAAKAKRFFQEKGMLVLGPAEISMRRKETRNRIVLKDKKEEHLIDVLWEFAKTNLGRSCEINMNPCLLEE